MQTYLKNRLKEPSTWAGIGALLPSIAQVATSPTPVAIASIVAALLAALVPEAAAS